MAPDPVVGVDDPPLGGRPDGRAAEEVRGHRARRTPRPRAAGRGASPGRLARAVRRAPAWPRGPPGCRSGSARRGPAARSAGGRPSRPRLRRDGASELSLALHDQADDACARSSAAASASSRTEAQRVAGRRSRSELARQRGRPVPPGTAMVASSAHRVRALAVADRLDVGGSSGWNDEVIATPRREVDVARAAPTPWSAAEQRLGVGAGQVAEPVRQPRQLALVAASRAAAAGCPRRRPRARPAAVVTCAVSRRPAGPVRSWSTR